MRQRRGAARKQMSGSGDSASEGAGSAASDAPARDVLEALHARLLDGDHTATAEMLALVLEPVTRGLGRRGGRLVRSLGRTSGEDLIHDVASDACMDYVKRPEQYNPAKAPGGLVPYLVMAAHGDLLNALPAARRQRQALPLSLVELRAEGRNRQVTKMTPVGGAASDHQGDPAAASEAREVAAEWRNQLAAQEAQLETQAERSVLRRMVAGERSTAAFAADLGIAHLDVADQRREVKRVKDKIKKRLQRAGLQGRGGASGG